LVAIKKDTNSSDVDAEHVGFQLSEQICYWRKHSNLQGYMQNLALKKGLVTNIDQFNCIGLHLNLKDLDEIREVIKSSKLPVTKGFFFGSSHGDQSELEQDLIAFDEAESYLRMGWDVVYSCWW
tara:strand:- start:252 stop:623 length:372 start_codon:yes stop_codon:yes gene_type:complete